MSVISGLMILGESIFDPAVPRTRHESGLTYGAGPAGYDVRIAETHVLPPGAFELGSIIEHMKIPNDLLAVVHDKSTWARQGLTVQNTVIEPGWRGFLTIELANHGDETLVIWPGMPIAQIIFHRIEGMVEPYEGRYQDQPAGPQPAKMRIE